MKKKLIILLLCALSLTFAACSTTKQTGSTTENTQTATKNAGVDGQTALLEYIPVSVEYDSLDLDTEYVVSEVTSIELGGDSISVSGKGVIVNDSTATITASGTYVLSGKLDDGRIIVNSRNNGVIKLVFDDVDITCLTSAPVYIDNAEKVIITLTNGSENYITDGTTYVFDYAEQDEPNAAVFSKCDLTINGNGSLTVTANYNNGIQSKDELKITGGTINIIAVNDGIKGKDCIAISNGNITIETGGDGMQSTNDSDSEKGFITVQGGTIDITAGTDGIQAETNVLVSGGDITIVTGGGSKNSSSGSNWGFWGNKNTVTTTDTSTSAKGIKAGINVTIDDGIINIDSSDDSIHSNDTIVVNTGNLSLSSGDDGIHSDSSLVINGGSIYISKSYEGIESSIITVNAGTIKIIASDDGINAAGGADGSSVNGRPGQNMFNESSNSFLYINDGEIYVNAAGDGLDINGSIIMTAGSVVVDGPVNDGNGALDYLGEFKITGGFLLAAGSSGMAQPASETSNQYSMIVNLPSVQPAGTTLSVETADSTEVLTCSPVKNYQSIVFSSPELKKDETYTVYLGESTSRTLVTEFTISSMVTRIGSYGSFGGGMRPGR